MKGGWIWRPQKTTMVLLIGVMMCISASAQLSDEQQRIRDEARSIASDLLGVSSSRLDERSSTDGGDSSKVPERVLAIATARMEAFLNKKDAMQRFSETPMEDMEPETRRRLLGELHEDAPPSDNEYWHQPLPSDPFSSFGNRKVLSSKSFSSSDYEDALGKAWEFYMAQRSGEIDDEDVPWRWTSHTDDKVPGGLYDAGDFLKLNFVLAPSVAMLAWGIIEFKDAYNDAGVMDTAKDVLKRAADYLVDCHDIEGATYIGQIGDPVIDHSYWGRPEQQKGSRPTLVYKRGMGASDLFAGVSAALSASSIVFKEDNPTYAAKLVRSARILLNWSRVRKGRYSDYYQSQTKSIYPSYDYLDAQAWGAAWLYRANGNKTLLQEAHHYWTESDGHDFFAGWDSQWAPYAVLMTVLRDTGTPVLEILPESRYKTWVKYEYFRAWLSGDGKGEVVYTPKGMAYPKWSEWGNLQFSTTAAFLATVRAKYEPDATFKSKLLNFAKQQVDYALGSTGRSFVIGFGEDPPTHAHHAAASCPDMPATCTIEQFNSHDPNPQVLYGGLVGGPGGIRVNSDDPDDSYEDKRSNYNQNEVANDYNAGFNGALAGLYQLLSR